MNSIRKRRNYYALTFVINLCLTLWFVLKLMKETAFIFGVVSLALLIFLIRQNQLLYNVGLIWDNCILSVPSATVFKSKGGIKSNAEETVVSTFGLLVGNKLYKWGCDGIHGVRLSSIYIDRARICLTFGYGGETTRVELLHGLIDEQKVIATKEKLWHETGVKAIISGW